MKIFVSLAMVVALSAGASTLNEKNLKSGPQPGEKVGAYIVEKCGGNSHDGVKDGAKLCYRCKMGNRPVVAVFSRDADKLVKLMKELNTAVLKNKEKKLAAFVNMLGKDADKAKAAAKALVKSSGTDNVAVVVPVDLPNGPKNLKLDPEAELTVLIFKQGTVEANHSFRDGQFDDSKIAAIVADANKMIQ